MRICLVHNFYQQPGGEDVVFRAEGDLLRRHGHDVAEYVEDNRAADGIGRARLAARTVWSRESARKLGATLRRLRPDVVHVHNTFLLISPSAYYACAEASVPVVQTLHNYRLLCPASGLYRQGRVCEECLGRTLPYPGVLHGCYRRSRAQTGVVAAMLAVHRGLGTWARRVDLYVALTEFARRKFVEGGLPADRIVVKPNFVDPDPGPGEHRGGYALFVGRLSVEKGVERLVRTWRGLGSSVPLKVVGGGPLERLAAGAPGSIEWLGQRPKPQVLSLMKEAAFLVFPSESYEAFPLALAEAFATGLPVIATRLGAAAEIVRDGETGLTFEPGDADGLASAVAMALSRPERLREMGRAARREFEAKYTGERNCRMLGEIYRLAIERARRGR